MLRAAHLLIDGEPKILADWPGLQLLGPAAEARILERRNEYQTEGARRLRVHVLLRSRYAEDRLAEAVARGVRQFVSLGAGGDTFAYRQPEWAHTLRIVEIDHPASQAEKRERLAEAGIEVRPNVHFAPVDFEHVSLRDALIANDVDLDQPVFFSWLGVTMYLTGAAVDAVFRTVGALPRGSELVFTFARARAADPDEDRKGPTLAERAAAVGEPWLTYFEPDALGAQLAAAGFGDVHLLTGAEAAERYFTNRTDDLPAPKRTSIVSAVVSANFRV